MTTAFPFADPLLISWDRALFDIWNPYFSFVANNWLVRETMSLAYQSLDALSVAGVFLLFFMGRLGAMRFFVVTFFTTAVICTFIGMFFPAEAAVVTLLKDKSLMEMFAFAPGSYHLPFMENLRSNPAVVFDLDTLPGLTTFPSFHTAAGVVFVYSFRGSVMFWPAFIYGVIMIAATPVFGGHYFVDLIAGGVLALVVCRIFEKRKVFEGVFAPSKFEALQPAE